MSMKSVRESMIGIIAEQLCVDESQVTDDVHFVDNMGADSLDCVELAMEVEDYYGIEIPDVDGERLRTLKGWVEYLESRHVKAVA